MNTILEAVAEVKQGGFSRHHVPITDTIYFSIFSDDKRNFVEIAVVDNGDIDKNPPFAHNGYGIGTSSQMHVSRIIGMYNRCVTQYSTD